MPRAEAAFRRRTFTRSMRRAALTRSCTPPPNAATRAWADRHVFEESVHSADAALPRRLPLLHFCSSPAQRRTRLPFHREVVAIAEAGAALGCKEALFTLGDKPELRFAQARRELAALGHETTISYLAAAAKAVLDRTGLLPHVNPGVMSAGEIADLRAVSVSQGIMLESASTRLGERGGPHFGSPDKDPAARLATIRDAGAQSVPFTSGILIGIGETHAERIEALLLLRDLHDEFAHLQEIIIQNFRPKVGTLMAATPAASVEDHLRTVALARLIFRPK